jgi:hypothetical protein
MNRRSFGLIVRLLAVGAAIYAFYSLKHFQQPANGPKTGPIPVTVVPADRETCGWITAEKVSQISSDISPDPMIAEAIASPGKEIAVKSKKECDGLSSLNGKVFGNYKIHFRNALKPAHDNAG